MGESGPVYKQEAIFNWDNIQHFEASKYSANDLNKNSFVLLCPTGKPNLPHFKIINFTF